MADGDEDEFNVDEVLEWIEGSEAQIVEIETDVADVSRRADEIEASASRVDTKIRLLGKRRADLERRLAAADALHAAWRDGGNGDADAYEAGGAAVTGQAGDVDVALAAADDAAEGILAFEDHLPEAIDNCAQCDAARAEQRSSASTREEWSALVETIQTTYDHKVHLQELTQHKHDALEERLEVAQAAHDVLAKYVDALVGEAERREALAQAAQERNKARGPLDKENDANAQPQAAAKRAAAPAAAKPAAAAAAPAAVAPAEPEDETTPFVQWLDTADEQMNAIDGELAVAEKVLRKTTKAIVKADKHLGVVGVQLEQIQEQLENQMTAFNGYHDQLEDEDVDSDMEADSFDPGDVPAAKKQEGKLETRLGQLEEVQRTATEKEEQWTQLGEHTAALDADIAQRRPLAKTVADLSIVIQLVQQSFALKQQRKELIDTALDACENEEKLKREILTIMMALIDARTKERQRRDRVLDRMADRLAGGTGETSGRDRQQTEDAAAARALERALAEAEEDDLKELRDWIKQAKVDLKTLRAEAERDMGKLTQLREQTALTSKAVGKLDEQAQALRVKVGAPQDERYDALEKRLPPEAQLDSSDPFSRAVFALDTAKIEGEEQQLVAFRAAVDESERQLGELLPECEALEHMVSQKMDDIDSKQRYANDADSLQDLIHFIQNLFSQCDEEVQKANQGLAAAHAEERAQQALLAGQRQFVQTLESEQRRRERLLNGFDARIEAEHTSVDVVRELADATKRLEEYRAETTTLLEELEQASGSAGRNAADVEAARAELRPLDDEFVHERQQLKELDDPELTMSAFRETPGLDTAAATEAEAAVATAAKVNKAALTTLAEAEGREARATGEVGNLEAKVTSERPLVSELIGARRELIEARQALVKAHGGRQSALSRETKEVIALSAVHKDMAAALRKDADRRRALIERVREHGKAQREKEELAAKEEAERAAKEEADRKAKEDEAQRTGAAVKIQAAARGRQGRERARQARDAASAAAAAGEPGEDASAGEADTTLSPGTKRMDPSSFVRSPSLMELLGDDDDETVEATDVDDETRTNTEINASRRPSLEGSDTDVRARMARARERSGSVSVAKSLLRSESLAALLEGGMSGDEGGSGSETDYDIDRSYLGTPKKKKSSEVDLDTTLDVDSPAIDHLPPSAAADVPRHETDAVHGHLDIPMRAMADPLEAADGDGDVPQGDGPRPVYIQEQSAPRHDRKSNRRAIKQAARWFDGPMFSKGVPTTAWEEDTDEEDEAPMTESGEAVIRDLYRTPGHLLHEQDGARAKGKAKGKGKGKGKGKPPVSAAEQAKRRAMCHRMFIFPEVANATSGANAPRSDGLAVGAKKPVVPQRHAKHARPQSATPASARRVVQGISGEILNARPQSATSRLGRRPQSASSRRGVTATSPYAAPVPAPPFGGGAVPPAAPRARPQSARPAARPQSARAPPRRPQSAARRPPARPQSARPAPARPRSAGAVPPGYSLVFANEQMEAETPSRRRRVLATRVFPEDLSEDEDGAGEQGVDASAAAANPFSEEQIDVALFREMDDGRDPTGSGALASAFRKANVQLIGLWDVLGFPQEERVEFVHRFQQPTAANYSQLLASVAVFIGHRERVLGIVEIIKQREQALKHVHERLARLEAATAAAVASVGPAAAVAATTLAEDDRRAIVQFLQLTMTCEQAITQLKGDLEWIEQFMYLGVDYEEKMVADAAELRRMRAHLADGSAMPAADPLSLLGTNPGELAERRMHEQAGTVSSLGRLREPSSGAVSGTDYGPSGTDRGSDRGARRPASAAARRQARRGPTASPPTTDSDLADSSSNCEQMPQSRRRRTLGSARMRPDAVEHERRVSALLHAQDGDSSVLLGTADGPTSEEDSDLGFYMSPAVRKAEADRRARDLADRRAWFEREEERTVAVLEARRREDEERVQALHRMEEARAEAQRDREEAERARAEAESVRAETEAKRLADEEAAARRLADEREVVDRERAAVREEQEIIARERALLAKERAEEEEARQRAAEEELVRRAAAAAKAEAEAREAEAQRRLAAEAEARRAAEAERKRAQAEAQAEAQAKAQTEAQAKAQAEAQAANDTASAPASPGGESDVTDLSISWHTSDEDMMSDKIAGLLSSDDEPL